ncbi:glycosyltransferase involved in cell wall biosynthesis [Rhodovulum iodosum]|uniref:Glycosyltransferase involved in cell wall biosynthesis n=1 Tax=Rhodovulum iodosum TaxID=68291 RepID=A0ABV3XYI8_9RHOB|nr:glycosyltransferase family 4 protein [Rhodovulum robiginosum]RSK38891.1 glycosyltransferase [Rhodovulum robiginosum]
MTDQSPAVAPAIRGRRLLIFQNGDYGAAFRRLRDGGEETYRDQRRSVEFVARLSHEMPVVVVAMCDRPHREELAPGLTSIGIPPGAGHDPAKILPLLDEIAPEVLICRSPNRFVLGWARRRGLPVLPVFADIFANDGLRQAWRNLRLRAQLGGAGTVCVANHSLNASRSVGRALLYPAGRIVPWDWSRLPTEPDPKSAPDGPWRAFFAGAISDAKGVGDCLEAVALLKARGLWLGFDLAGGRDLAPWQARAARLGIDDRVRFLGMLPHAEVRARMRAADLVVVPSRHDYAEGLPNTIYEALASRSPLVISDHPAFAGRLRDGADCLVFRAASPDALADRVAHLMQSPDLYRALSEQSAAAHERLYIGLEWLDLVSTFLRDPGNETGWVARNALARLTGRGR